MIGSRPLGGRLDGRLFSSEEDAKEEYSKRQEMRKQTIKETGHSLVEETMGPVLSIMSEA